MAQHRIAKKNEIIKIKTFRLKSLEITTLEKIFSDVFLHEFKKNLWIVNISITPKYLLRLVLMFM